MIQGYVDVISKDGQTLTGWVQTSASGQKPILALATQNGQRVGSVAFGPERVDVTGALGIPNRSFTLTLDSPVDGHSLLVKASYVVADMNGESTRISLGGHAYHNLMGRFVKYAASNIKGTREVIVKALDIKEQSLSKHIDEVKVGGESGNLSYIGFPVGLRSSDGIAQIGKSGQMFLVGGSNALREQYREPATSTENDALQDKAQAWMDSIRISDETLGSLGIPFLQLVIPEKLTVLRHLAPFSVTGPTPLYRRLDELMTDEPHYLSFLKLFDCLPNKEDAWLANDTHCSPAGSLEMARALLRRLPGCDESLLDNVEFSDSTYRDGDLSGKFFDIPIWVKQRTPGQETFSGAKITHEYEFNPGHFVGSHNIWKNETAPIKKKLVVFGNSFFGGVASPTRLGWWMSRLFSEYHMKWQNTVDVEYVEKTQADFVIAQTIERFLVRPPVADPGTVGSVKIAQQNLENRGLDSR